MHVDRRRRQVVAVAEALASGVDDGEQGASRLDGLAAGGFERDVVAVAEVRQLVAQGVDQSGFGAYDLSLDGVVEQVLCDRFDDALVAVVDAVPGTSDGVAHVAHQLAVRMPCGVVEPRLGGDAVLDRVAQLRRVDRDEVLEVDAARGVEVRCGGLHAFESFAFVAPGRVAGVEVVELTHEGFVERPEHRVEPALNAEGATADRRSAPASRICARKHGNQQTLQPPCLAVAAEDVRLHACGGDGA